jgi:cyclopropane fatty-acyl-phospholipid synthase-like methyltransferase
VIQFCYRRFPPDRRQGVRALDLGCGSGVHTVFLASEGFDVAGVDRSPVGIENTRRRLDARGLRASLAVCGAESLDLPAASVDLVICVGVYDSAGPAVARASLERLTSIMKPGASGFFLFASDLDFQVQGDNLYKLYGFTRREVEGLFEGFDQVWIDRYITTYQGGAMEQNDWLVTLRR